MTQTAPIRIGIDLGGTKIEVAALAANGKILYRKRVETPRDDYRATLTAVSDLVAGLETQIGHRCTVGVGIPGTISPATGLVKNANSVWLIGNPLDRDLAALLDRPVRVQNDANCFALSEATDGAGKGAAVVFGAILGTGVGGGVVVHGRLVAGVNAIGGEWGHSPLPWPQDDERPGPQCYCGLNGCIETFLSGPALSRDHGGEGGVTHQPRDIAERAMGGDALAQSALERYEDRLARALATVINLLDPDVIVLGGGLSNIGRLTTAMPDRWSRYVFSDRVGTRLVRALHGDSSGVRGAAWLWSLEEAV